MPAASEGGAACLAAGLDESASLAAGRAAISRMRAISTSGPVGLESSSSYWVRQFLTEKISRAVVSSSRAAVFSGLSCASLVSISATSWEESAEGGERERIVEVVMSHGMVLSGARWKTQGEAGGSDKE